MNILGWLASILLALCALPQTISAIQNKACYLDKWFLWLWLSGEILGLIYVAVRQDWPLILNYLLNTICTAILVYHRKDPAYGKDT